MSNTGREPILKAIAELCAQYPDWRFGQLVANVAGWADQEIWDVEDEQLLEAARAHLEHLSAASPAHPEPADRSLSTPVT